MKCEPFAQANVDERTVKAVNHKTINWNNWDLFSSQVGVGKKRENSWLNACQIIQDTKHILKVISITVKLKGKEKNWYTVEENSGTDGVGMQEG